jgi:hypothetical protein
MPIGEHASVPHDVVASRQQAADRVAGSTPSQQPSLAGGAFVNHCQAPHGPGGATPSLIALALQQTASHSAGELSAATSSACVKPVMAAVIGESGLDGL